MGIASVNSSALHPVQTRSPTAALQASAALKTAQAASKAHTSGASTDQSAGSSPRSVLNSLGQAIGQNLNVRG